MSGPGIQAGPDAKRQRGSAPAGIAWHLLSIFALVIFATELGLRNSLWELPAGRKTFVVGLALAHTLVALVLWWRPPVDVRGWAGRLVAALAIGYGGFAFGLLMVSAYYSRLMLFAAVFVSAGLAVLPALFPRLLPRILMPGLGLGIALLFGAGAVLKHRPAPPEGVVWRSRMVSSAFHLVRMSITERLLPSDVSGGAVQTVGSGFVIATGDGTLHFLEHLTTSAPLTVRTLPYRVPINREVFAAAAGSDARTDVFRLTDLQVTGTGSRLTLVAAHHHWVAEEGCFVLRVSVAESDADSFLAGSAELAWRPVFDARPCLRLRSGPRRPYVRAGPFSGEVSGGRLAALDSSTVLLTVGDHGFDGWNSEEILAQDPQSHYGKVVSVDLVTGAAEIVSSGHRNPQGLLVTRDAEILLTEHGPQGGDEMNFIERDNNYGWPYETYGVQYEMPLWPLSASQGRHARFTRPRYAWIPSVGVSNLILVERNRFPAWQGDLLVGALGTSSLYRLRYRNGRVLFSERINVNQRVRDLAEAPDGRIVMLADGGSVAVLEPAEPDEPGDTAARAALLFARCQGCHRIGDGSDHGIGPDLRGVIDREIAAAPGYLYSQALRGLSGRWSEERLSRFLENPSAYAPGTTMESAGVPDPAERALLIRYLRGSGDRADR